MVLNFLVEENSLGGNLPEMGNPGEPGTLDCLPQMRCMTLNASRNVFEGFSPVNTQNGFVRKSEGPYRLNRTQRTDSQNFIRKSE